MSKGDRITAMQDLLDKANGQILRQGEIIEGLLEALGPASDEIFDMVIEQIESQ